MIWPKPLSSALSFPFSVFFRVIQPHWLFLVSQAPQALSTLWNYPPLAQLEDLSFATTLHVFLFFRSHQVGEPCELFLNSVPFSDISSLLVYLIHSFSYYFIVLFIHCFHQFLMYVFVFSLLLYICF